jgi:hypothetical protein
VSKATWLTPAAEAWEARMGAGTFPAGPAAKFLKPLTVAGHSMETIALHLGEYLSRTNPQYLSLPKFAMTFAQWAPGSTQPEQRPPLRPQSKAEPDFLVDDTGVLTLR